jgi:hypothetical protein
MSEESQTAKSVTCRKCRRTYIPDFVFDFYPDGDDPSVGLCEKCMLDEAFEPKKIEQEKLTSLCRLGSGREACSFLMAGAGGFACAKGSASGALIYQRREVGTMNAIGDYCGGPPTYTPIKGPSSSSN